MSLKKSNLLIGVQMRHTYSTWEWGIHCFCFYYKQSLVKDLEVGVLYNRIYYRITQFLICSSLGKS